LVDGPVTASDLSIGGSSRRASVDDSDLRIRPRVDELERELIARALAQTGGNQTRAADLLGLSRYGLQKKMRRLELST
jgi:transcriptional regulator with GAF, ATPase, and Fis domain